VTGKVYYLIILQESIREKAFVDQNTN